MKVMAKKGTCCPMDGKAVGVITDNRAVEVPDNTYYRRRLLDGSLVRCDTESTAQTIKEKGDKK